MNLESFLKLVEIQTKAASMLPLLLGTTYALYRFDGFSITNFVLMLLSLLTFDMTTTAMNNYIDYKKAIKTYGYGYESHNAIVKYHLKEKTVIITICTLLITAIAAGVLLFLNTDFIVLLLGALSFGIGIIYSFGPVPISRTPLGEFFSGFTMGFVITFLSVYIHIMDENIINLSLQNSLLLIRLDYLEIGYLLLVSILPISGIANIMLANNICDIEDDRENRRYTLPVYIGKEKALKLFAGIYYVGYASVLLSILLGTLPLFSILSLCTLFVVNKNIQAFNKLQTKKDTFVLAVKNFAISNAAQVAALGLGVLYQLVF